MHTCVSIITPKRLHLLHTATLKKYEDANASSYMKKINSHKEISNRHFIHIEKFEHLEKLSSCNLMTDKWYN